LNLETLRAVVETLVPDGAGVGLAERVAAQVAHLPRAADQAELTQLLGLMQSPIANVALGGVARSFTALDRAARERYLRGWATSRLPAKRKAFQALKRLTTVAYYTAVDGRGTNPSWPALGYPGPLGPAPQVPKPIRPLAVVGDTVLDCDVVVIGSGAGGGVMAGELAAQGKDVVVLEKGAYLNESDFSQLEGEMLERAYDGGGLLATDDLSAIILQGSCLGGGTVVNYTTSFHTPEHVREEWAREHGLPHFTTPEFTRSLDTVAQRIHVTTDAARPSARDAILIRGLERCGWHHGVLPRDVKGCTQDDTCGYCGYGCRRGAKQSTLLTYLQDAHDRGARIVTHANVRRVTLARGKAAGVEAMVHPPGAHRAYALTVRARAVVVACGSIHSPALLLRSGVSLPALGRHLALHPATAVLGDMDEPVRPWTGTVQAHYSDQFADLDQGYGFKFETAPMHPSLFALAVPWESGAAHRQAMTRLSQTTLCGILLRDRDGGRVRVDRAGNPIVRYRLSRYDARHLRRAFAAAGELLEAAGAKEISLPLARRVAYRPGPGARARWLAELDRVGSGPNQMLLVTFHQMASCRMGANAKTSVVDARHQVWNVPGLYVADASVFPTASGVNPMLTIMGMAHRAAGLIGAEL
jgi:choline dehydrogenase-like flavoprotein